MTCKEKIILDCDPGEDDALAILLAIKRGLSLTTLVCGYGNSSADNTYRNGAGLLTLSNKMDIPLYKGSEEPYKPHPLESDTVSAGDFVGKNGLCGISLPYDAKMLTSHHINQDDRTNELAEHIRQQGPLTYIITGPCTTFAHILDELGDEAKKYINQVIIMGGALDACGNHGPINSDTGKSYAEFNCYCDPHGTDRVLNSNLPIIIVPWDLTEQIVLTYKELPDLQSHSPEGDFVINLVRNFLESYGNAHERSFEFNDCITISALQEHGTLRKETINIILKGEQTGRIIRDKNSGKEVFFFDIDPAQIFPIRNSILEDIGIKIHVKK
jgi:inosine-uridine nucleoside N-ribohydrolase